jgi:hypothetical protein
MFLLDRAASWMVGYLTSSSGAYQRRVPNDMARLKEILRPGDIVLVEGGTRISEVIKYLTQSSWSHAAIYVGDGLLRWGGAFAGETLDRLGPDAGHLLIESDMRLGVIGVPLSKYEGNNLRICRPHGLRPEDLDRVLEEVFQHMGVRYDKRNILDLARYLTPFHLLPAKLRRKPLYFGSSGSREIICSALIAKAFYKVNYPIQPIVRDAGASGSRALRDRVTVRHPSYIMPRDFDLSANFEIVKHHLKGFDYRDLALG